MRAFPTAVRRTSLDVVPLIIVFAVGALAVSHAEGSVSIVDPPAYVCSPDGDLYGMTAAVMIGVEGPVEGVIRLQVLSDGKIVNRMWNGSEWVYPYVYDRGLHLSSDGDWTGHVCFRLYGPYFPEDGLSDVLTIKASYRNGTGSASAETTVRVVNGSDIGTVRLMVFDGSVLADSLVLVDGPERYVTATGGSSGREGVPWAGTVRVPLLGNCTVTVGPLTGDLRAGPGMEFDHLIGHRDRPAVSISELCADPRGENGTEWIELRTLGPVDLSGCILTDGEVTIELPPVTADGEFIISFDNGTENDDETFHVPLAHVLANAGDGITLIGPDGGVLDHVSYGNAVQGPPVIWNESGVPEGGTGYMLKDDDGWADIWWGNATPGYRGLADRDGSLKIVEVYYNTFTTGEEDEFVIIMNDGSGTVYLSGWELTDWEDVSPLNGTLAPGERVLVTSDLTSLLRMEPDLIARRHPCTVLASLDLRLSNGGDEVVLRHRKGVIDAVVYGDGTGCPGWDGPSVPVLYEGELCVRGGMDTNTSDDWALHRLRRLGQSTFLPERLHADSVTAMITPDCTDSEVLGLIGSARESIHVEAYEVLSPYIAESLATASRRGVNVSVLLDGAPVGWNFWNVPEEEYIERQGTFERAFEEKALVDDMVRDGVDVRFHGSTDPRYVFIHSKCIVTETSVLISSDNLVEGSYPHELGFEGTSVRGSRGWAVILNGSDVAGYFRDVMIHDLNGYDVVEWGVPPYDPPPVYFMQRYDRTAMNGSSPDPVRPVSTPPLRVDGPVDVLPVLSPDSSAGWPIVSMIENATSFIYVELLDLNPNWSRMGSNRYLDALLDAAGRGVDVRILLDPTWAEPGGSFDNYEMAEALFEASTSLPTLRCRLLSPHGLTMLHNKGVVADGRVLVSSINWGFNSVFRNREIAVVIEHADIANYYAGSFLQDWNRTALDQIWISIAFDGGYSIRLLGINGTHRVDVRIGAVEVFSDDIEEGETRTVPIGGAGGVVTVTINGTVLRVTDAGAITAVNDAPVDGQEDDVFPHIEIVMAFVIAMVVWSVVFRKLRG